MVPEVATPVCSRQEVVRHAVGSNRGTGGPLDIVLRSMRAKKMPSAALGVGAVLRSKYVLQSDSVPIVSGTIRADGKQLCCRFRPVLKSSSALAGENLAIKAPIQAHVAIRNRHWQSQHMPVPQKASQQPWYVGGGSSPRVCDEQGVAALQHGGVVEHHVRAQRGGHLRVQAGHGSPRRAVVAA
jgi:hypothetical protein